MSDMAVNQHTDLNKEQDVEMCSPVVELRQYTLKPGRRDELIGIFEEHFVEGQEQYGSRLIGQFCARNNPDLFVWMRGFSDMETRRTALTSFYYGPVWQTHSNAANDTMIDSDNVLQLKPARITSGFHLNPANRPAMDAKDSDGGVVIVTIYYFAEPVDAEFVEFFETEVAHSLCDAGATLLGYFVTDPSENVFPPLPIREGENVFIWFASFADNAGYEAYQAALKESQVWNGILESWLSKPEEVLELVPCRRSLLRHHS